MRDRLAGVRIKLARAEHHLGTLEKSINAFLAKDFYSLRGEQRPRQFIFRVDRVDIPDPRWGVYVGEVVYNLRSALDHLAYELAVLNLGDPLPAKVAETSAFPIFRSGPRFRRRNKNGYPARGSGWEKVKGMERSARTAVERLQPYHRRKLPELVALRWLDDLCNIDKHRTIHLTASQLEKARYGIRGTGVQAVHNIEVFRRPFKKNAMLARLTVEWSPGHVDMETEMVPDIAFDRRTSPRSVGNQSVLDTLYGCRNVIVSQVLPKLVPFFPKGERIAVRLGRDADVGNLSKRAHTVSVAPKRTSIPGKEL